MQATWNRRRLVTSPEIVQAKHALLAFAASRFLCVAGRPLLHGHSRSGIDTSLARAAARMCSALQLRLEPLAEIQPLDLLLDVLHLWLQLRIELLQVRTHLCVHLAQLRIELAHLWLKLPVDLLHGFLELLNSAVAVPSVPWPLHGCRGRLATSCLGSIASQPDGLQNRGEQAARVHRDFRR